MSVMSRPRLGNPTPESKRASSDEAMRALVNGSGSMVRSKRRPKILAGGVGLILATALLGAVMFSRGSEQRTAIVAATDIGVGEVITTSNLRVVRISRDADVASLPSSEASQLVDRVAAVPIRRGSLVLPEQVTRTQSAPPGTVLIGAVLEAGALPSPDLRFGDRVRVLLAPSNPSVDNAPKIATEAVVWRVWGSQQSGATRRAVTLAVPEKASVEVGAAAAQGSIRLLVVPNTEAPTTATVVDPLAVTPTSSTEQPATPASPVVGN